MIKRVIFTSVCASILVLMVFLPTRLLKNYITNEWSEHIEYSKLRRVSFNTWRINGIMLNYKKIHIPFTVGTIEVKPTLKGSQILFSDWRYEENYFDANLGLNWYGDLNAAYLQFKISGDISGWFDIENSLSEAVKNKQHIEIQYEDGYIEIRADHKKIFRASWLLRKQK